jgi:glycerate 2-kinase
LAGRERRRLILVVVRVLVCPDKFAGSLSADAAAAAIAAGWSEAYPSDQVVVRPLADGGPGLLDVVARAVDGRRLAVSTVDPLLRPVPGWLLIHDRTAYVESAQACGLHLLSRDEYDPLAASSYGLGVLVRSAAGEGVETIVVGLGGSATNDGGAGMLAALGAVPVDGSGHPLPPGGLALADCVELHGHPDLGGARLVAATDVDNPLVGPYGASVVFGPQKGARERDVDRLDAALVVFAAVLSRSLAGCPPELDRLPGGGAAGGLGAAILALGGRRESGFELVRRLSRLDDELDACDLVITGEGSLDEQSVRGKAVGGVAAACRDRGKPCVVLSGRVTLGRAALDALGVAEARSLVEHLGSVERALADAAPGLAGLAAEVARAWRPRLTAGFG